MALVANGQILQVAWRGRLYGQRVLNVQHLKVIDVGTVVADQSEVTQELADQFAAEWDDGGLLNGWRDMVLEDFTMEDCQVQWLTPTRLAYVRSAVGRTGEKAAVTTWTANVAASITLRGDRAGRQFVGRQQVAGISPLDLDAGVIDPAVVAVLRGAFFDWLADSHVWNAAGGTMTMTGIILRRNVPAESDGVQTVIGQPEARTQRTRTVGKGE